jgi:hypothetical protein
LGFSSFLASTDDSVANSLITRSHLAEI